MTTKKTDETPKKTDETTKKTDETTKEAEKTEKPTEKPKKTRNDYHQLTKDEVLEIIENLRDKEIKVIKNKYNTSLGQIQKLFSMINNTNWKPIQDGDELPKGYMVPRNINQIVKSIMYDKGYVEK